MGLFNRAKRKCSQCGTTLKPMSYFSDKKLGGKGTVTIGDAPWLMKQMEELNSAAYKCRGCGTLICRGCITVGQKCPKCDGVIFDLVEDEEEG